MVVALSMVMLSIGRFMIAVSGKAIAIELWVKVNCLTRQESRKLVQFLTERIRLCRCADVVLKVLVQDCNDRSGGLRANSYSFATL